MKLFLIGAAIIMAVWIALVCTVIPSHAQSRIVGSGLFSISYDHSLACRLPAVGKSALLLARAGGVC